MRKIAFLLFSVLTVYIAGMYRLLPLVMMFTAEMLLFIGMYALSRLFRYTTEITLQPPEHAAYKGEAAVCRLVISRRGRLPLGQFRVRLQYRYDREKKNSIRLLYCSGTDANDVPVSGSYCGLLHLKIDRLRFYDYLQLFSSGRRVALNLTIPVFPRERSLRFERAAESREATVPEESTLQRPGESYHEIRQIREYRPGDAKRFIHWNQSARTGSLWIKEYETQEEPGAELLVDTSAGQPLDAAAWDAFYELFSAVVLGLLQCSAAVQVYWYDPDSSAFRCDTVYAATQCREVLFHLYQAEPAAARSNPALPSGMEQDHLRLTTQLELYCGRELLARFTQKNLQQEINERIITI